MKRARFTEEQIIAVLKEHETGVKTADLARKHGISEATFYNWKAKYSGMDVSEARRLKALEDENAKLKKLRKRSADPLVRSVMGSCESHLGSTRCWYGCRRQNGRPIGRLEGEPRQSA